MAMSQRKAFNRKMLSPVIRVRRTPGIYDDNNYFVEGTITKYKLYAVVVAGNKFSQFDEGISRKATSGGERFPDWRTMYVSRKWGEMNMSDEIIFRGTTYNILQKSDEAVFQFSSYLLEKVKDSKENHL